MSLIVDKSEGTDSYVVAAQSMGGLLGNDSHEASWCCLWMAHDPWGLGSLVLPSSLLVAPLILLLFRVRILFFRLQEREVFLSWSNGL